LYAAASTVEVTSWNMPPSTLTKPKHCFMRRDMPSEKLDSCSLTYSLMSLRASGPFSEFVCLSSRRVIGRWRPRCEANGCRCNRWGFLVLPGNQEQSRQLLGRPRCLCQLCQAGLPVQTQRKGTGCSSHGSVVGYGCIGDPKLGRCRKCHRHSTRGLCKLRANRSSGCRV